MKSDIIYLGFDNMGRLLVVGLDVSEIYGFEFVEKVMTTDADYLFEAVEKLKINLKEKHEAEE